MNPDSFAFYLGRSPESYGQVKDGELVSHIMADLEAKHGKAHTGELGAAYLAWALAETVRAARFTAHGQHEGAALALLRQLLDLYEGQRLAPPETFASYWQEVRALLRNAERAADA